MRSSRRCIAIALVLVVAQPKAERVVRPAPAGGAPQRNRPRPRLRLRRVRGLLRRGSGHPADGRPRARDRGHPAGRQRPATCSPGLNNFTAGVIFVFAATVNWGVAALIAGGSIIGGALGARYGRRLLADRAPGADRDRRHRGDRAPPRRLTQVREISQRKTLLNR